MKRLLTLLTLIGVLAIPVFGDPVCIGGGTAAVANTVGIANWDATGLRIQFTVINTSVEPLSITAVSNSLAGPWVMPNLALVPLESATFLCELPGVWQVDLGNFISATTIYFNGSQPVATPEPATLGLLGLGLIAAARRARLELFPRREVKDGKQEC